MAWTLTTALFNKLHGEASREAAAKGKSRQPTILALAITHNSFSHDPFHFYLLFFLRHRLHFPDSRLHGGDPAI